MNRLKLYDTKVKICLNHIEKEKLRKRAYKNKLTMSEYIRRLIMLDNKIHEIKINNSNFDQTIKKIEKYYKENA